ncbi:LysE family translocator [Roseateles oligotrophus]|uniref:LysE family translocator n=1 Tax=Roseateles oligotrophus TaxID=1769250 RepID=A0ABT2YCT0_9BURK|nr:LysE family translocator [Roseateles oligotrophus]MCV2367853.1 LysE family translocator [Roseateles oligotrophus]
MLLSPAELLPLMSYCFVMSGTPGPNNVMLASSGANFGYRRALPLIIGIQVGGALLTFVTCLGLGSLFNAFPVLHQILRVTGALYLIFLAWKLGTMKVGEAAKPLTITQAALFQAVNPKSWMKSITLASVFMPAGLSVPVGALLVTVTGVLVGLPISSTWALFGVAIRRWLDDPLKRRIFNLSMGGTLLVLAISFLR